MDDSPLGAGKNVKDTKYNCNLIMKNFYLTFGQKSPAKDEYVLIVADNYDTAFESEPQHGAPSNG